MIIRQSLIRKLLLSVTIASLLPAAAQFDQTINVSGEYIPEVIDHNRISSFPARVKFPVADASLDYDLHSVTANFTPRSASLDPAAWNAGSPYSRARGYLDVEIGSWLNSSLAAGYRFIENNSSIAGIALNHNSTSLWHPRENGTGFHNPMWRYDEALSLYARHNISPRVRLEADAAWNIDLFNYYGVDTESDQPDQIINRGSLRLGFASIPASLPAFDSAITPDPSGLAWNANLKASYFGFGKLPGTKGSYGTRQADLNLDAGVAYAFNPSSSIGLDLDGQWLLYFPLDDGLSLQEGNPDNYGNISISPHYMFASSHLDMTLGANLEITTGISGYNAFHAAPRLKFCYHSDQLSIWLNILGGQTLRTADYIYNLDPYSSPLLADVTPIYTPVDATLGFNLTPISGFSIGADLQYRVAKNVPFGGDYMYLLSHSRYYTPARTAGEVYHDHYNLNGFSAGVNFAFDFTPWFALKANGRYQPQSRQDGFFNGFDRPRWTLGIAAETNPWSTLRFSLAYDLRAVRTVYLPEYATPSTLSAIGAPYIVAHGSSAIDLPDLSMLGARISYSFSPKATIFLKADNLLNRKQELLPAAPSQGITITVGANLRF